MTFHQITALMLAIFPISEVLLGISKRAKSHDSRVDDQGTLNLLWITIIASCLAAQILSYVTSTRFSISSDLSDACAIVLLVLGLALRWYSIVTLGRFFTVNVAIHRDQQVVQTGPYRYLRHPSYTGYLLAFVGIGMYLRNWLSLVALLLPITVVTLHRIKKEEEILVAALGPAYQEYRDHTKRLIPWVY
jgi:protein-S-isoprenylcysteine O-methyltransferase